MPTASITRATALSFHLLSTNSGPSISEAVRHARLAGRLYFREFVSALHGIERLASEGAMRKDIQKAVTVFQHGSQPMNIRLLFLSLITLAALGLSSFAGPVAETPPQKRRRWKRRSS